MRKSSIGRRKKRQVNQYDKIFRENMEVGFPGVVKNILGIETLKSTELPDDVQHTRERRPDVLKVVKDSSGDEYVLHIEFQTTNEKEMAWRMAEYYIMLSRMHKLMVRQYVIYIGKRKLNMSDQIRAPTMHYRYRLIALSNIDYRVLLSASQPQIKMLAMLADFGNDDPQTTMKLIVNEVLAASEGDFLKRRHFRQLLILSQLCKFKTQTIQHMEIASFFKKEKDFLYKEGVAIGEARGIKKGEVRGIRKGEVKGKEEAQLEFVKSLLLNTNFSITKIANIANVSQNYVRKVKRGL